LKLKKFLIVGRYRSIIKSKAKKEAIHLMDNELELKEIILFNCGAGRRC